MIIDTLAMSDTAKTKWLNLTRFEQQAVDRSFMAALTNPMSVSGCVELRIRFENGYKSIDAVLLDTGDCLIALGIYKGKVPVVLDIVVRGDVCFWVN